MYHHLEEQAGRGAQQVREHEPHLEHGHLPTQRHSAALAVALAEGCTTRGDAPTAMVTLYELL